MSDNFRSGFVTIVGRPNVGKSTLMNHIIGQKIAITSNKPQTTRNRIQTVYTDEEVGQIVFLDTPGMHEAKNKLGEYMMSAAKSTINDVDLILWLVEPDTKVGAADKKIAELLSTADAPIMLVINKIDMADGVKVGETISAFKDLCDFVEVVPVSALHGEGCEDLLSTIFKYLPEGPAFYDPETVTNQTLREITAEIIREKSLHALNDEVPHGIGILIDSMKERPGKRPMWDIEATIVCEKNSHKGIIIGKGGAMIKKIGTNARYEIEKLLEAKVNLKLFVKVKKDWRESEYDLKTFGYKKEDLG
ncbi:MAG: GTPase Era [Pseudobutyrivibrio ruminis]|uniref:GTPase Era n=1 Tax=Pseudobutyrivibrio ruminis TaxID=46206 RepID=UPI0026ED30D1|nr:GTPase Era [Pseudobutyrivibrio ruminis]MBE5914042.1 GTPase Era [Pseudobutyrivibrio ruminis]